MEKPAVTNLDIHPLLKKRWSPRSFTSQKVDNDSLARIFEAARWAPSSFNDQPWRFIVGRKGDKTWDMILETLVEFNQQWAKLAPVLVLSIGKKISTKTGKPNRIFEYDLGQGVAYLTFQAMHEGLFMHQMGGLDKDKAASIFNVPEDYQVLTAMAIGHKGEPELLEGDFVKMEKSDRDRLSAAELVFEEEFGQSADFTSKG
ncbi:MAG: nitroreductase [Bacteroidetes bacterium]|nr:MAG: nitroreductase [Bacteroidota bacterium]